jgi:hypothetical protein
MKSAMLGGGKGHEVEVVSPLVGEENGSKKERSWRGWERCWREASTEPYICGNLIHYSFGIFVLRKVLQHRLMTDLFIATCRSTSKKRCQETGRPRLGAQ